MKSCLTRFFAVLFGLFVALLIVEIGVRLAYRALPQTLQIALQDVRITPFSDVRLVPPPIWQPDYDYQTVTRPGITDETAFAGPGVSFPVNTYAWFGGRVGFRSPQPTDGTLQAAALGDSFTFCFTPAADCWVDLLARQSGLQIANMGQPVTGTTAHLRILRTFALPVKPKLVLWQFFGNDFNDDYGLAGLNGTAQTPPEPSTLPALPTAPIARWLREHSVIYAIVSALLRRDAGVEQFIDPYQFTSGAVRLAFGEEYVRKAFDLSNPRNLEGEMLTYATLRDARKAVEGYGGAFVVLLMPTKEEVWSAQTAPIMGQAAIDGISAPRMRMHAFCEAEKLTCLDLFDALKAQADAGVQGYYERDMHLNARGNQAVADAVAVFLRERGLLN